MLIRYTEPAIAELQKHFNDPEAALKLVYDTDGCGCAVSGVAQLWLVSGQGPEDELADGGPFRTLYERRQEIFFEDELQIDYRADARAFRLSSRQQIYNHAMSLIDKRPQR